MHLPISRLLTRLGIHHDWYLVAVAAAVGLLMAGVAMAFILPIHALEDATSALALDQPTLVFWLVLIAPCIGALLTGIVLHALPVEAKGYGIPAVMYAIHREQSRLPLKLALAKWLASTLTIGSGGSAGPEGPIVTIGASIGATCGRWLRANPHTSATLLGCGAAAGIASVFNAPIAGIFFVLEVLLRDFSLRTFTPIVIASVVSAATTQTVLGSRPLFGVGPEFFADAKDRFTVLQTPNYLILGVVCGVVSVVFIRSLQFAEDGFAKVRIHPILKPAVGGALLGVMGLLYLSSGISNDVLPPFYGNGYHVIHKLLSPTFYLTDAVAGVPRPIAMMVILLVGLLAARIVATCLTLGSGGSGGLFAPSLVLGATVGGAFGHLISGIRWFSTTSPAHYALVGMAAMVAATTHAPLTAILIVYEITRSYDIILPLMLASVISTVVGRLLFRESIYTAKLARMGVRLGSMGDLTVLRRLTVDNVPLLPPIIVKEHEPATRVLELTETHSVGDFVVVDDGGAYIGMVTGVDLRAMLVHREALPLLQVADLVRRDLPTASPDEHLDLVLDKFSDHDVHCLVVTQGDPQRPVGIITRSRLMSRYQQELEQD
jgi:chloride channel protein, CIC family